MTGERVEGVRSLLEAPSPAVLITYRNDGSANGSPVWFRWADGAFEIVIAEGDVKLRHLARDPRCALLVFEAVPPFRGVEVRGTGELVEGDVAASRADIAGRYLGERDGERFAADTRLEAGSLAPAGRVRAAHMGPGGDPAEVAPGESLWPAPLCGNVP